MSDGYKILLAALEAADVLPAGFEGALEWGMLAVVAAGVGLRWRLRRGSPPTRRPTSAWRRA